MTCCGLRPACWRVGVLARWAGYSLAREHPWRPRPAGTPPAGAPVQACFAGVDLTTRAATRAPPPDEEALLDTPHQSLQPVRLVWHPWQADAETHRSGQELNASPIRSRDASRDVAGTLDGRPRPFHRRRPAAANTAPLPSDHTKRHAGVTQASRRRHAGVTPMYDAAVTLAMTFGYLSPVAQDAAQAERRP
jgi:hypothetical protein